MRIPYKNSSVGFLLAVVSFFLFTINAQAATVTSAATGDWSNPATWGGSVPGSGDDVIIATGHTVTLTANTSIGTGDLSIQGSGVLSMSTFTFTCDLLNMQTGAGASITTSGTQLFTMTGATLTVTDATGGTVAAISANLSLPATATISIANNT